MGILSIIGTWEITQEGELNLDSLGKIRDGSFEKQDILLLKTQNFNPSEK